MLVKYFHGKSQRMLSTIIALLVSTLSNLKYIMGTGNAGLKVREEI